MNVLIVKTSSLGDVIHTLPAITDAANAIKDIQFDWVVEKNFSEIPLLHPAIREVIPVSLREWRKKPFRLSTLSEIKQTYHLLRQKKYDYIVDAQGLLKSGILTLVAQGKRCSFSLTTAREPWLSFIYNQKVSIQKDQHAIERIRQLFAGIFKYEYSSAIIDYGISAINSNAENEKYIVLLHGTTWTTKHWPEIYWQQLAKLITNENIAIKLIWGNETEYLRAQRISEVSSKIQVLEKLNLKNIANLLTNALGVVAADTGLGHLSAALARPTVSLFGPTDPKLTGARGLNQLHLHSTFACAPCLQRDCTYKGKSTIFPACFAEITPEVVWNNLKKMMVL